MNLFLINKLNILQNQEHFDLFERKYYVRMSVCTSAEVNVICIVESVSYQPLRSPYYITTYSSLVILMALCEKEGEEGVERAAQGGVGGHGEEEEEEEQEEEQEVYVAEEVEGVGDVFEEASLSQRRRCQNSSSDQRNHN